MACPAPIDEYVYSQSDARFVRLIHNNKMVVAGFDANCPGRKQIRPGKDVPVHLSSKVRVWRF